MLGLWIGLGEDACAWSRFGLAGLAPNEVGVRRVVEPHGRSHCLDAAAWCRKKPSGVRLAGRMKGLVALVDVAREDRLPHSASVRATRISVGTPMDVGREARSVQGDG